MFIYSVNHGSVNLFHSGPIRCSILFRSEIFRSGRAWKSEVFMVTTSKNKIKKTISASEESKCTNEKYILE